LKTHTHCKEAMVLAKSSTKCGDAEAATRTASTTPETNTRPGSSSPSSPRTRSEWCEYAEYARVGTRTRACTHSVASPQKRAASTTRSVTPGETSTSSAKRRRGGATSASLFGGDHVVHVATVLEMESGEMESDYDSDSTVSYSDWSDDDDDEDDAAGRSDDDDDDDDAAGPTTTTTQPAAFVDAASSSSSGFFSIEGGLRAAVLAWVGLR
jgi:hypothetical protein